MKNIIKVIAFLTIFIILFIIINNIFSLKVELNNGYGTRMIEGFYKEKEESIDVLNIGSSHMYCTINPSILWREYGITSYNFCGASQPIWTSYYFIVEALKTQKPKLIILEAYKLATMQTEYSGNEGHNRRNIDNFKFSKNKIDLIETSVPEEERWSYYFNFAKYHSKWKELKKEDFTYMFDNNRNYLKGYGISYLKKKIKIDDMSKVVEREELSSKSLEYLNKIIELANENDIELLFIASPYQLSEKHQKGFNTVADICKEKSIPFINYNLIHKEIGINLETDFRDVNHANDFGSEKITRHLAKYIKANYDIEDKRTNSKYQYWNDDIEVYYNLREELRDIE